METNTLNPDQTAPKQSGPRGSKLFPYSTQLSTKFILLINVKMPTIVGILIFISMINLGGGGVTKYIYAKYGCACRIVPFFSAARYMITAPFFKKESI